MYPITTAARSATAASASGRRIDPRPSGCWIVRVEADIVVPPWSPSVGLPGADLRVRASDDRILVSTPAPAIGRCPDRRAAGCLKLRASHGAGPYGATEPSARGFRRVMDAEHV